MNSPLNPSSTPSADDPQAAGLARPLVTDIVAITGEADRARFYERLVESLPEDLIQTALTDTRDGLAAGRVRNAGAYFIASVKRAAAREGLALPARASTTSRTNAACTNATCTNAAISDIYTPLQQARHALRQSAIAIRDATDDAIAALQLAEAALRASTPFNIPDADHD